LPERGVSYDGKSFVQVNRQFTRTVAVDWAVQKHGQRHPARRLHDRAEPALVEEASGGDRTLSANIPMGDFGQPEDLGPLAVYLASDAARCMTGAALVIDGGYTLL
jgi:NAD(P)-dependent dehydrogenase (short-subunit alcohol dehydrogenase family)